MNVYSTSGAVTVRLVPLVDRLADIAFLAPATWLPGALSQIVLLGVTGGVLLLGATATMPERILVAIRRMP